MTTAVIGLGKLGLPLAVQFAMRGEDVIGVDINVNVVQQVNAGIEPFPGEWDLQSRLREVISRGKFIATTSTAAAASRSETILVIVPVVVDDKNQTNFESIDVATTEIAKGLKRGSLVIYETTLPIGTTRQRFASIIESTSGLVAGVDYHLVFSPERVLTGRVFRDLKRYPKIVGGITAQCAQSASDFYNKMIEFDDREDMSNGNGVWIVGSCETAEFVKLAETTYRDVNIALANQFALHAEQVGVNIHEVIAAANSQPFSHIHEPGVAVGGHCIPVYPRFYLQGDPNARLVSESRQLNEAMPNKIVQAIEGHFGNLVNRHILILGLSYRSGVKETYGSGALEIIKQLQVKAGKALVHDEIFTEDEIEEMGLNSYSRAHHVPDAIVVQISDMRFLEFIERNNLKSVPIFDGRKLFPDNLGFNVVYQLGNPKLLTKGLLEGNIISN
jgi:nucleotide sugar dehydrogenase